MNFVKLYIGDYLRDTGTLTLAQHGAYTLMLLQFYATEKPLPTGRELHRLLRADGKNEREAIDFIASRFWAETDAGLVNKRALEEIEKASRQREINRELGKRGGRPRKTESVSESVSETEPNGEPNRNPNHSQTPEEVSEPTVPHPPAAAEGKARQASVPCPYQAIVDAYHQALPTLPRVRLVEQRQRQVAMRRLWGWVLSSRKSDGTKRANTADEAMEWLRGYFARASENDFLMGRTPRGADHAAWQCDFDFLLTDRGMRQVIEKTREMAA